MFALLLLAWELTFVSDLNIRTGTALEAIGGSAPHAATAQGAVTSYEERVRRKASGAFGGLSGIAYHAATRTLYALSDSSKPVFFRLQLGIENGTLKLAGRDAVLLSDAAGEAVPLWSLDPEGIAVSPDGTLLIASEGYPGRTPPVHAGLFEFDLNGRMRRSIEVPSRYLTRTEAGRQSGVRVNGGFEGLSVSPDGTRIFAAAEAPLLQDGESCRVDRGCSVRIVEIRRDAEDAAREYLYPVDPMRLSGEQAGSSGGNGVSEILALNNDELLVLERGYAHQPGAASGVNQVRIFHVDLRSARGDQTLSKSLLLDLDDVKERFAPGYRSLDNFEGMCFGPTFPDGSRSVILVSDDNYQAQQRTAFLLLRLRHVQ